MSAVSSDRRGVLFLMRSPAYVRNFESVLRELAERGMRVTVLFEERKPGGDAAGLRLIGELASSHEVLTHGFVPPIPLGFRGLLRKAAQIGLDYLRYFEPPFEHTVRLRARPLAFLPARAERLLAAALRRSRVARRALASAVRAAYRSTGVDRGILAELERHRPSALVVTPLVHFGSRQNSWIRAARRLGVGTMVCVYGWDNLTNRGLMHELPDRLAVWNETQCRQAIELHRAEHRSITVCGAWPYDHWFEWEPTRSRSELCRRLGIREDRAIVLYVCSSRFIAEHERDSVARWVRALREAPDERLATASVIVRPHPLNRGEWRAPWPEGGEGVTVFPANGRDPVSAEARSDYFDSLSHADAVVGVNTSALIESAIVDRPALAFPGTEFRSTQGELPHFVELTREHGAIVTSASMAEHVALLSEALADPGSGAPARQRFVASFIRPNGAETPPTARVADAIEELCGGGAARAATPDVADRIPR